MKGLSIVTPTQDHLQSAFRVFEASIADAFEQEGLGHLKDDIRKEIEYKQMLLSRAVENPESGYLFLIAVLNGEVVGTVSLGPVGMMSKGARIISSPMWVSWAVFMSCLLIKGEAWVQP